MVLKWQEAAFPLAMVLVLIMGKYLPGLDNLPLSRLAGIICFSYAIFLSLRLVQAEEAIYADGWSQLRPSALEVIGGYAAGGFTVMLLGAVILMGGTAAPAQLFAALFLAIAFALCGMGIAITSLMVRVRWNRRTLEHRDSFGRVTTIAWTEVAGVKTHWRGITIWTRDHVHISFSPYHCGAAALMKEALTIVERNARPATSGWPLLD